LRNTFLNSRPDHGKSAESSATAPHEKTKKVRWIDSSPDNENKTQLVTIIATKAQTGKIKKTRKNINVAPKSIIKNFKNIENNNDNVTYIAIKNTKKNGEPEIENFTTDEYLDQLEKIADRQTPFQKKAIIITSNSKPSQLINQKEINNLKIEAKKELEKNIKSKPEVHIIKEGLFEKRFVFAPSQFNSWQNMRKNVVSNNK